MTTRITASDIRFIRLGRQSRWADRCLEEGRLELKYIDAPHDACLAGDWDSVRRAFRHTEKPVALTRAVNEVKSFYTLGPATLWITFHRGRLWWTRANPEVSWLGGDGEAHGTRMRAAIGGWRDTDLVGRTLTIDSLSGILTRTNGTQNTICKIGADAYLLRRLNGEEMPEVTRALAGRKEMLAATDVLIRKLPWREFETLADLILPRSGWQRISPLGGSQKGFDLTLAEPLTGETMRVQVKSEAGQPEFDACRSEFLDEGLHDRLTFVCHSPRETIETDEAEANIQLWTGESLAAKAIQAGLLEWIIERSG